MTKYLDLPDGSAMEVPDDVDYDTAMERAQKKYPDAFKPAPTPEGGFMPAAKAGIASLKGEGALLAGKLGLMDTKAAEDYHKAQEEKAAATFKPTEEGWTEAPWQKTKEALGGAAPVVGGTILAAGAAGALGGPLLATGIGAGSSYLMHTGQGLASQMREGNQSLEETSLPKAAVAAVPEALFDMTANKLLPGVRGIFASAGKEIGKEEALAIAKQGTKQILADYAKETGKAVTGQSVAQAANTFLDRLQSGASLADEKARDAYLESAMSGAVVAGAVGPAGRYVERGKEAQQQGAKEQARQAAETQAAQEAESARQAAPEFIPGVMAQAKQYGPRVKALEEASKGGDETARTQLDDLQSDPAYQQFKEDFKVARPQIEAMEKQHRAVAAEPMPVAPEESGESYSGTAIAEQLATATAARTAAIARAADLARKGDFDGAQAAQKEATQQAEVMRTLHPLAPEPAPPTPPAQAVLELQAELARIQGGQTARGKPKMGMYESALRSGDTATADALMKQMQELKSKIELAQQREAPALTEASPSGEEAPFETAAREHNEANAADIAKMEAARMDTGFTEQHTLFDEKPPAVVTNDKKLTASTIPALRAEIQIARATGNRGAASEAIERLRQVVAENDARVEKTMQSPESALGMGRELDSALGASALPKDIAQRQASGDAQATWFAKLTSTLARYNGSPESIAARKAAINGVRENMLRSIELDRKAPLAPAERADLLKGINAHLHMLVKAFEGTHPYDAVKKVQGALEDMRVESATPPQGGAVERIHSAPTKTSVMKALDALPQDGPLLERVQQNIEPLLQAGAADDIAAWAHRVRIGGDATDLAARVNEHIDSLKRPVREPAVIDNQTDREARDGAARAAEQARMERLADMPGERIDQSERRAAENLPRANQERDTRRAMLEEKAGDPTVSKPSQDKAKRELKRMAREDAIAESTDTANARLRELTEKRIPALEAAAAEKATKTNKQELAKAKREAATLQRRLAGVKRTPIETRAATQEREAARLADERAETMAERGTLQGDEETRLQPGRISQASKKERIAGNIRTGDVGTVEQRTVSSRNKVTEQRRTVEPNRSISSKEMQAANRDADAIDPAGELRTKLAKATQRADDAMEDASLTSAQRDALIARRDALAEDLRKLSNEPQASKEDALAAMADHEIDSYDNIPDNAFVDDFAGEWEASAKRETEGTRLPRGAESGVINNDVTSTLQALAKDGSTADVRALAEKLQPYVEDTRIGMTEDLKYAGEKVAGLYTHVDDRVQIHKGAMTEETLLHELTHAATMQVLDRPNSQLTPTQRTAVGTLDGMYRAIKSNKNFEGEYGTENLKEFVSEVYTNPELRAKMDAIGKPQTLLTRFVEAVKRLFGFGDDPASKKAMAAIDRIMEKSGKGKATASPMGAAESFGRELTEQRSKLAQLNASKSKLPLAFEQKVVDMRASLRRAFAMGDAKTGTQAHYSLLTSDAPMNNLHAVAQNGAMRLGKDDKGYVTITSGHSASAKDVFKAIGAMPGSSTEAKLATFQAGITALRARDVGWEKLGFTDAKMMKEKGEAALREINANPEMKKAFDHARSVYRDLNHGMVKFLVETNALPEALGHKMLTDQNYVPFFRESGDSINLITQDGHPVSIGDIRSQPFLKALKGGDEKLMPFQESVFKNIAMLTNMGVQNMANRQIAYHLQGLGREAGVMQIKRGNGGAGQDVFRFRQKPDPTMPNDTGERHIVIDTKGTAAEGIPTDLLAQSAAGAYATIPTILKVASYASDVLRSGVTRMPTYLVSQTFKDPFNAAMLGNLKRNPVAAAIKTLQNFTGNLTGKSADAQTLQKHGVLHSNVFNGDYTDMKKVAMQIVGNDQSSLSRFLAGLDHVAMTADAATREQHFRDVRNAGGSEVEGVVSSREMQNFNKRGSSASVQMISRMIPFFNASIQGLNVMAKAVTGDLPASKLLASKEMFYKRAMGMSAMTLAYAMAMDDDPDWKKMSLRDKMGYIHLPKFLSPSDEALRIPAPFETGMMFYSFPVALVEAMRNNFTDSDWQTVRDVFMNQLPGSGSIMPQALKGAYDVSRNYDSFSGRPIEPKGVEHLAAQERFNARTTEAAKALSKQLTDAGVNLSPLQIEYLTNAYVGQMPQAVAAMTNQVFASGATGEKPKGHADEIPMLGRFFQNERGSADIQETYDRADEAIKAKATLEHMVKAGRADDAKEYMKAHKADIALQPAANSFRAEMLKLKQSEDAVRNAARMSAEDKQTRLDKITAARQTLAERYNNALYTAKQRVSPAGT